MKYCLSLLLFAQSTVFGGTLKDTNSLQTNFQKLASDFDGSVGICALDVTENKPVCLNEDRKFPLQSVMKLIVAAAVMDAVDRKQMLLSDEIVVRPEDASPGPQEFADLIKSKGSLKVTVKELVRRAVNDSDSTSVDVLLERLGGTASVQEFLKRKKTAGISIDRDERHLQAESIGFVWKPEFSDSAKFEAAIKSVPSDQQDLALNKYLKDPRDTATPSGMALFLAALSNGKLLSKDSTKKLLDIMAATKTGRGRLSAGVPTDWKLGHKTGTGRGRNGAATVTNDVGIITAPDGGHIAIAVFIANSNRPNAEQDSVIANAAKLVTAAYGEDK